MYGFWRRLFFGALAEKKASQKIAYTAVITAFVVVSNMFEIKLAETQFSLTIFMSAIAGILIGPLFGGAAAFLGDLVGFLYNSNGYPYYPWVGLNMLVVALFAGLIVGGIEYHKKWFLYVKLALVCLVSFFIGTVRINTTAFWLLYSKIGYGEYLISRLFIQGQIWNNLANYALLFIVVPTLNRIKPLKIRIN